MKTILLTCFLSIAAFAEQKLTITVSDVEYARLQGMVNKTNTVETVAATIITKHCDLACRQELSVKWSKATPEQRAAAVATLEEKK